MQRRRQPLEPLYPDVCMTLPHRLEAASTTGSTCRSPSSDAPRTTDTTSSIGTWLTLERGESDPGPLADLLELTTGIAAGDWRAS